MMYTAYIKSETFHLPIAHHTLVLDVKNRLYSSKDFSQHAIGKLYPINRINHDCIIVEKQNTTRIIHQNPKIPQESRFIGFPGGFSFSLFK